MITHQFCDPEQNNRSIGVTIDGFLVERAKVFTVLQKLCNCAYHDTSHKITAICLLL